MALQLSHEEFRLWAAGQRPRCERIADEPIAMSPECVGYAPIKDRARAALDQAARQANLPREALGDGMTGELDEDTDDEPDAVVNCRTRLSEGAIAANSSIMADLYPATA